MADQHRRPQEKALRRLAVPSTSPAAGLPLIKTVPSLGRMLEWRRARSTVEEDMPEGRRKTKIKADAEIFIKWMEQEDGAHFRQEMRLEGPFPHLEARPADIQVGDRGGTRPRARNVQQDATGTGKEDYIIWALFDVPEYVQEIPTEVALDIFGKGARPDLRPLRPKEFAEVMKHGNN